SPASHVWERRDGHGSTTRTGVLLHGQVGRAGPSPERDHFAAFPGPKAGDSLSQRGPMKVTRSTMNPAADSADKTMRRGTSPTPPPQVDPRFAVNGAVRLAYDDLGPINGDPLLMIMGTGASRVSWAQRP